jgi:four helix bundle protein
MTSYQRFEDLPVWQTAAELFQCCDDFLESVPRLRPSFRDQLERAVVSVSNNIAEGFERGTTNELLAFLYIARGSAGEVRSMLLLLERKVQKSNADSANLSGLKANTDKFKILAESCSRQLRAWADSLQNSEITGQRHLNEKSRKDWDKKHDKAEGIKRLDQMQIELVSKLPIGHPVRRQWEQKHGPLKIDDLSGD